jgi:hypothetical protein
MIDRSGFLRASLLFASVSLVSFFAACGGKVVGDPNNQPEPDAGYDQQHTTCGELGPPDCPTCEGETNAPSPQCGNNGEWICPVTKCEPPPGCNDTTADCKCGIASCVNDEWVCPADCSDTCPADITGLAGTACSVEGLICGGEDCTNPCDFCNFIGCTGGVWTNEESPPEPCPIDGGSFDGG